MPKVIAVTPAGRRNYLEILTHYIQRDHHEGIIDEWHLWLNTNDQQDINWCRELSKFNPWIKCIEKDPSITVHDEQFGYSIYQFYTNCVDPDAIYVRLDDDIVFIEKDAIRKLVDFRIVNPGYFLVFANIINNAICSHLHQRMGVLPSSEKLVGYDCLDFVGWSDPEFAVYVHETFFNNYKLKKLGTYKFSKWELYFVERFSINCFAFFGKDFAEFNGIVGENEESWLSEIKPAILGRANVIFGESLVSHFAFYPQRNKLDQTNILDRYQEIALRECSVDPWTSIIVCN